MANSRIKTRSIRFKVILLGDGAVGKTTLKKIYLGKGFQDKYKSTLGADLTIKKLDINNKSIKCDIWDLAGQPRFSKVRNLYYTGSSGAILVYDITQPNSLENLNMWISEFDKYNTIKGVPLLIVGNKIDLREMVEQSISPNQGLKFVERLENQFGPERFILFLETSAKMNINVNKVFEKLIEAMLRT
ncbi:MAG: Rab family GTPase [Candidatus Hodarchaeota archaeon]